MCLNTPCYWFFIRFPINQHTLLQNSWFSTIVSLISPAPGGAPYKSILCDIWSCRLWLSSPLLQQLWWSIDQYYIWLSMTPNPPQCWATSDSLLWNATNSWLSYHFLSPQGPLLHQLLSQLLSKLTKVLRYLISWYYCSWWWGSKVKSGESDAWWYGQ